MCIGPVATHRRRTLTSTPLSSQWSYLDKHGFDLSAQADCLSFDFDLVRVTVPPAHQTRPS